MSYEACAQIVERADPDRFLAAMAAPVAARKVLFPIYAFNVEVTRAPWLTDEEMIAEMRLQWWRDVLAQIAENQPVRSHEVATELAKVLDTQAALSLDRLIAARRWDIYKDPFEDHDHFNEYLDATTGELMWQAARLLGALEVQRPTIMAFGHATGLTRYLQAVPKLEAAGRIPLVDGRSDAIAQYAGAALKNAQRPSGKNPATLEGWQTRPILSQVRKSPGRVAQGALGLSEFRKRLRLLRWA